MQLIMSPPSPFVRKVRVLLRETGLIDQVEEVQVSTSPLKSDPQALSANPLGKIPALIRPDGPALYDSRVITRYLDDLAQSGLYPASSLFEVLTLEATADAIMEASVGIIYDQRYRPGTPAPDWTEAQWAKVERALEAITTRWASHLSGPLTMGQIAVGCALGYLDLRHSDRGWRDTAPQLALWFDGFAQRPSMIETNPT